VRRTDLDPDARRALRREQSQPLLAQIDTVRQDLMRTVLPKSPLGDAVRYLTNQWTVLQWKLKDYATKRSGRTSRALEYNGAKSDSQRGNPR
jgi:transposase IS66 family protein